MFEQTFREKTSGQAPNHQLLRQSDVWSTSSAGADDAREIDIDLGFLQEVGLQHF